MPTVQPSGTSRRVSTGQARYHDFGAPDLRDRQRPPGSGLQPAERARPRFRRCLSLRPRHDAGDPRRLRVQPPGDDLAATTAPANRPMSSRLPRGSTGPASASISTATSAASTWSARTRSCCATTSRSPSSARACCPGRCSTRSALCFDEYDAGRPDVMFVIQRVLEVEGKLTLLDQNRVIRPHPGFRLFSTANTVGLGDTTGLYHGTQQINQGQMDRWNIVATLELPAARRRGRDRAGQGAELRQRGGPAHDQRDGGARRSDPQPASSTATSRPSCRRARS